MDLQDAIDTIKYQYAQIQDLDDPEEMIEVLEAIETLTPQVTSARHRKLAIIAQKGIQDRTRLCEYIAMNDPDVLRGPEAISEMSNRQLIDMLDSDDIDHLQDQEVIL